MEIEFGFRKEKSSLFGEIKRPVARVILINKEIKIPEIFYVDSGADITLIPRSVGELLQLEDPVKSEIFDIKGISDKGISIVVRKISIQISSFVIRARVGWALTEHVPMLLGREDIFPFFNILFLRNKKTIFHSPS